MQHKGIVSLSVQERFIPSKAQGAHESVIP